MSHPRHCNRNVWHSALVAVAAFLLALSTGTLHAETACRDLSSRISICEVGSGWTSTVEPARRSIVGTFEREGINAQINSISRDSWETVTQETIRADQVDRLKRLYGDQANPIAVETTTIDGRDAETTVVAVSVRDQNIVYGFTVVIEGRLVVRVDTFDSGTEYTPTHRAYLADLLSAIRIKEAQ
ncbi:MAG TPA: hypothetical protein PKD10_12535 [Paracoccaceae bacterium]|nr:hypothetical protein [Paracoccaceae bacterium]HMO70256.1 hypothetical protein [Paracoccaceae bacterium]